MKIPRRKKIKLNTWRYQEIDQPKDDDGDLCYGVCDFESRTISIKKRQGKNQKLDTLLHENLHAAFYEIGLKLTPEEEEQIVSELCAILMALFRLTPR